MTTALKDQALQESDEQIEEAHKEKQQEEDGILYPRPSEFPRIAEQHGLKIAASIQSSERPPWTEEL